MQGICALGRVPKQVQGQSEAQVLERRLATRLSKARAAGAVSAAQETELANLGEAVQLAGWSKQVLRRSARVLRNSERLLQDILAFGRVPKTVRGRSKAQARERNLAVRLRKAREAGDLCAAQEAQLAELRASEIGGLEEAEAPPDALAPFADDAASRLEQDLLMFSNDMRTRALQRRVQRYQRYVGDPALQSRPEVQKYREPLEVACASAAGPASYVAGRDIQGDVLRTFACTPEACGPLTCQLCAADFLYEADFGVHKDKAHGGEAEYRKRVLYHMDDVGCRPITAQEKRVMVQNFSHFQQFSRPGAKGNTFARVPEVPRCEAACALCQQKDFIEHRHKLSLFSAHPRRAPRGLSQAT